MPFCIITSIKAKKPPQVLTTDEGFFFVLVLWFLGLIDSLWRAADVSKEAENSAGELKSNGSSAADVEELVGTENGLNGIGSGDLVVADLESGEIGGEHG